MRHIRHKDNFYKVEKETLNGENVEIEYSHKVCEHLPNVIKLDSGNHMGLLTKEEWITCKEISDLEFWIWNHLRGDK